MTNTLTSSSQAPDFTLCDQHGNATSLKDLKDSWVVIYFYPRALTPGCSQQTFSLEENKALFEEKNVILVGISPDNVPKQLKFAQKYNVSFPLLADENAHVATKYGVWQKKSMYGKEYMGIVRTTFILSPDHKIAAVIPKPKPANHTKEVIDLITKLQDAY